MTDADARAAFHGEVLGLVDDTARLGGLACDAVMRGSQALLDGDLAATEVVIEEDQAIDDLVESVEERVYGLLALQGPVAVDMRILVTVLRSIHELELVGDLMVDVAKAARRLYPYRLEEPLRGLVVSMRDQAWEELKVATSAFADRDVARALALSDMDDAMNDLQKDLFRVILRTPATEDASVQRAVQMALVGRFLERVADHAVNIAQRVVYMVTGRFPPREERDAAGDPPGPPGGREAGGRGAAGAEKRTDRGN